MGIVLRVATVWLAIVSALALSARSTGAAGEVETFIIDSRGRYYSEPNRLFIATATASSIVKFRNLRPWKNRGAEQTIAATARAGSEDGPRLCEGQPATLDEGLGGEVTIVGSPGDDVLVGSEDADYMSGRGGNDLMCGGPGDDEVVGRAGDDRILGQGGSDRVRGQVGADVVMGGRGHDVVEGRAGDDRVVGGAGEDVIGGGAGSDRCITTRRDEVRAGCESG